MVLKDAEERRRRFMIEELLSLANGRIALESGEGCTRFTGSIRPVPDPLSTS